MGIVNQEYLKECFEYDPNTGICIWKKRPLSHFKNKRWHKHFNEKFAGRVSGCEMGRGYKSVTVGGKKFIYHRMIFTLMGVDLGNLQVDHINGDTKDNRWENLRLVTQHDNLKNKKLRKGNKSGVSGVSFIDGLNNPFRVSYYLNGHTAATFKFKDNLLDAACLRKSMENILGYHKNHGRDKYNENNKS